MPSRKCMYLHVILLVFHTNISRVCWCSVASLSTRDYANCVCCQQPVSDQSRATHIASQFGDTSIFILCTSLVHSPRRKYTETYNIYFRSTKTINYYRCCQHRNCVFGERSILHSCLPNDIKNFPTSPSFRTVFRKLFEPVAPF